jgi:hypothetical protein
MFTPEVLFIWNVEQLLTYHDKPTPENLFSSVGPLRRILLDETPLIHLANRKTKLKIVFISSDTPDLPRPWMRKTMSLETFLKEPVIHFSGTAITVKDAINYVRNYAGLEHKNEPDTDVMRAAEIGGIQFRLAGMPSVLYALRSVIGLTLTGCMPLYEKLKELEKQKKK